MEFLTAIEPINNTDNYTLRHKELMILITVHNLQVSELNLLCALHYKKHCIFMHMQ